MSDNAKRSIGLLGATAIGVGAIVGGGILALSGVAYALTGPSAVLAFMLNGVIALISALSFAELATAFPQSGGTYTFAKRVLSVGAAFAVGWVVWFASIVAAALYAVGFAAFLLEGLRSGFEVAPDSLLNASWMLSFVAITASALCAAFIIRSSGGGGLLMNVSKVIVFSVLIFGACLVSIKSEISFSQQVDNLRPFFANGAMGLIQAMGATFIALQGFDLIAAVAGEVRDPRRNLPRAMLYSLGIALVIYVPFLVIIPMVGMAPGESIQALAAQNPDTIIASSVGYYLGSFGYWMVISAGILSMASALLANVFAAARIAQAMARDRTLSASMEKVHPRFATPYIAIIVTSGITICVLLVLSDVAAAGSTSSLIFLLAFTLTHILCIVTRKRKPQHTGYRLPGWPYVPAFGAISCFSIAVYQAITVPSAGIITVLWILIGAFAYAWHFGRRAKIFDAASEANDPDLLLLRGLSPLVLAPIANPKNAALMAAVAGCIAAPRVGRVLLLNVMRPPQEGVSLDNALGETASVLRDSMAVALRSGVRCESLATVASDPWQEISRVAQAHRCASVLIGVRDLDNEHITGQIEKLFKDIEANLLLLRAASDWKPDNVKRVLIPIGGRAIHVALRARLLAGLNRRSTEGIRITYLLVDNTANSEASKTSQRHYHSRFIGDETNLEHEMEVVCATDVAGAICSAAETHDLIIMGLGKPGSGQSAIGPVIHQVLKNTNKAVLLLATHR